MKKYILFLGFVFAILPQFAFSEAQNAKPQPQTIEGKWCKGGWDWTDSQFKEGYTRDMFEIKDNMIVYTRTCMKVRVDAPTYSSESIITALVDYTKYPDILLVKNQKILRNGCHGSHKLTEAIIYDVRKDQLNFYSRRETANRRSPSDIYYRMKTPKDCLYKTQH